MGCWMTNSCGMRDDSLFFGVMRDGQFLRDAGLAGYITAFIQNSAGGIGGMGRANPCIDIAGSLHYIFMYIHLLNNQRFLAIWRDEGKNY